MRSSLPLLLAAALLAPAFAEPTAEETDARAAAHTIAGAFTNDGFTLRDGHLAGELKPGAAKLVQVNLYAGNEYWFTLAAGAKAKKIALALFDEAGAPVEADDTYEDGPSVAVGFAPVASGPYYLKMESIEGEAAAFCLVYSYK